MTQNLVKLIEKSINSNLNRSGIAYHDNVQWNAFTYSDINTFSERTKDILRNITTEWTNVLLYLNITHTYPILVLGTIKSGFGFTCVEAGDNSLLDTLPNLCLSSKCIIFNFALPDDATASLLNFSCQREINILGERVYFWVSDEDSNSCDDFQFLYSIRTSGTTGISKYIRVPHSCIYPNIKDFSEILQVTADDRILLMTPVTFDPSIVELLLGLSNGCTMCLLDRQILEDPQRMREILFPTTGGGCVTLLQTTPSLLKRWSLRELRESVFHWKSSLRALLLGGEEFPSIAEILKWNISDHISVYNVYGITEVSCWATVHRVLPSPQPLNHIGECLSETSLQLKISNDEDEGELLIGRHLKSQHGIDPGEQQTEVLALTSDVLAAGSSSAPLVAEQEIGGLAGMKRGSTVQAMGSKRARVCPKDRSLEIDCSLAKMIALNQLPISFCASDGFKQFMATVEPNYVPCGEAAVKSKLRALAGQLKRKVKENMSSANFLSCSTDSWTSIVNCAYITVTAHFVDDKWNYCSATLTTHETDQRQTVPYLADQLRSTMEEWEILEKVVSFTTDNAKNFTNAIKILEVLNVRCAAHTIQLAINKCLKVSELQNVISSCSQLVSHFKHSSVATKALKAKQEMLGLPPQKLLQSCPTRWDSVFRMLERISGNRCPLMATLADKNVIPPSVAAKLELNEASWTLVGDLCKVLKPVQVATTLFCAEDAPMAMVRPTLHKLIAKHFEFDLVDGDLLGALKASLKEELKERFWPDSLGQESMERVATIFDPRFKGMEFETPETRDVIIAYVQREIDTALESSSTRKCIVGDETVRDIGNDSKTLFRSTGDIFKKIDGKFYYQGRNDDFIKRWGTRVSLREVEKMTRQHEDTADCSCVALKFENHQRLSLFVVQPTQPSSSIEKLGLFLKKRLNPSAWPDQIEVLPSLPLNKHGKVCKRTLRALSEDIMSRTSLESVFTCRWTAYTLTPFQQLGFISAGGNSFSALQFFNEMKLRFSSTPDNLLGLLLKNTSKEDLLLFLIKSKEPDEAPFEKSKPKKTETISKELLPVEAEVAPVQSPRILSLHSKGKCSTTSLGSPGSPDMKKISLKVTWKFNLMKCVDASPVGFQLSDGRSLAIVGSHSGQVIVFNIVSGEVISRCTLPDRVESSACLSRDPNLFYIGCYDSCMYCINIQNGIIVWNYKTGDMIKSTAISHEDKIIFGSYDSCMYCLEQVGILSWKTKLKSPILSEAVIRGQNVYSATLGSIAILNVNTGQLIKEVDSAPIFSNPVLNQKALITANVHGKVTWVNCESLKEENTFSADDNIFSSLVLIEDGAGDGEGRLLFGCSDSRLYCLRGRELAWTSSRLDAKVVSTPYPCPLSSTTTAGGGFVCSATSVGTVYLIDLSNGNKLTQISLPGEVFSSPVVIGSQIIVGCRDDHFYVISILQE